MTVIAPGFYDIREDEYHADPVPGGSLSASGAKLLVHPSTPAHYRWAMDHHQPPRRIFDIGTATHGIVLGTGPRLVEIPAKILASNGAISTTAAKEFVAKAQLAGEVALKPSDYAEVHAMAAAVLSHPVAGKLFEQGRGQAEQSLFWPDPDVDDVYRRARLDWIAEPSASGRIIVADLKTAVSAHPAKWAKQACDLGAHIQHANYTSGIQALTGCRDVPMVFVVVEKSPPYLVSVIELDSEAVSAGRMLMDRAARTLSECRRTGVWPGYSREVVPVGLPPYYYTQLDAAIESEDQS